MSLVTYKRDFFAGIDVGQVNDHTAMAVIERVRAVPRPDLHHALTAQAKEEARIERERRANPTFTEQVTRQLGKSVQRGIINRVAGSIVRGIFGNLFRGR